MIKCGFNENNNIYLNTHFVILLSTDIRYCIVEILISTIYKYIIKVYFSKNLKSFCFYMISFLLIKKDLMNVLVYQLFLIKKK